MERKTIARIMAIVLLVGAGFYSWDSTLNRDNYEVYNEIRGLENGLSLMHERMADMESLRKDLVELKRKNITDKDKLNRIKEAEAVYNDKDNQMFMRYYKSELEKYESSVESYNKSFHSILPYMHYVPRKIELKNFRT